MEDHRAKERKQREQVEVLRTIVEAGTTRKAATGPTGEDKVKVLKLTESDDMEAYLTTFEWMMTAYEVPDGRWAFKLLTGLIAAAHPRQSLLCVC